MSTQYETKCQKELLSLDKSIQIKRKSEDSNIIEDKESINKKSKTNESDKKIVCMHAKYSK